MRKAVGVLAVASWLMASIGPSAAQPMSVPQQAPEAKPTGGNTNMPVTMTGGTEVLGAETEGESTKAAPVSLERPIDPNTYICGPGDIFELNFWGQQNFRLRIAADLEGRTFISRVGFVEVAGKTLADVRTQIKKKVRGNYPGLQFDLVLVSPRTFQVHIVDNVKQPGNYVAHPLERLSSVLSRAGGATGSRRQIAIHRKSGDVTADLVLYEITGDVSLNPFVLDGDVITIPAPGTVVKISGPVRRPGSYELIKGKDISELVELAGGFTSSVARTLPLRVVRRNERQQETFNDLAFSGVQTPNMKLLDDDEVIVGSTIELQRMVLLIGAVAGADPLDKAAQIKRLPFIEGDTVRSLIERAGGIRAPGDLRRSYISRPQPGALPKVIPVDLEALLVRRDFTADKPIIIDDSIVVPPMQYSILVEGAVGRAGIYNYNPRFGIPEYIAHAGGRTRTAEDMDDVRLIEPDGGMQKYRKGMTVQPGDAILVPERTFTRAEVVQIVIATAGLLISGVAITLAATR